MFTFKNHDVVRLDFNISYRDAFGWNNDNLFLASGKIGQLMDTKDHNGKFDLVFEYVTDGNGDFISTWIPFTDYLSERVTIFS